ncbi:MAG TPA: 50S ribosomal protein L29 [Rhabdochlamydiaceae bacterium]|nr:50S ribosomal protein L29 [Rhabdochlamydiaceae bacterium]
MKRAKEYRDQSHEELKVVYKELSKEIFDLNNELRIARKIEKPHLLRLKKRDRARVLTILREKEEA